MVILWRCQGNHWAQKGAASPARPVDSDSTRHCCVRGGRRRQGVESYAAHMAKGIIGNQKAVVEAQYAMGARGSKMANQETGPRSPLHQRAKGSVYRFRLDTLRHAKRN